jgi:hypothetical protein
VSWTNPPTAGGYTETAVVSDPTNSQNLFVGSNQSPGDCRGGTNPVQGFKSADAGATWSASSALPETVNTFQDGSTSAYGTDPAPAFDGSGTLFYSYLDVLCQPDHNQNGSQLVIVTGGNRVQTGSKKPEENVRD